MIVMTYFHPWTLATEQFQDEHVPHARHLRKGFESWTRALEHWFAGRVLSTTAVQYINNFLSVTRARPQNDQYDDENSDDVVSDEELFVSTEDS